MLNANPINHTTLISQTATVSEEKRNEYRLQMLFLNWIAFGSVSGAVIAFTQMHAIIHGGALAGNLMSYASLGGACGLLIAGLADVLIHGSLEDLADIEEG